jgi:predicted DNA-binding transcriptional regulator
MITLSPDEVTLIRSLLTALRGIKVRDIDKALVILSRADRHSKEADYARFE